VKQTQFIVNEIRVRTRLEELDNARKVASRRSGARGKAARTDELAAEERLRAAEEKYVCSKFGVY
jgi:ATP-binding cassette subfamily F protein 3